MAENSLSALVQLIVDKAQARTALQRELKELQREAQIETDVKVNLSDVKQARKEIQQANREQQAGTRENIKLRAQELANARMIAKETKVATDLEIANRQRASKLSIQASKEQLANAKTTANATNAQLTQELSERKNANAILRQEISERRTALQLQKLQTQEARLGNQESSKLDKIQFSIDNGHGVSEYQNRIKGLISDFEKYGVATDKAKSETQSLQNIFDSMKGLSGQKLVTQADKFEREFDAVKISIQGAKLEFDKFAQPVSNEKITSLITRIDTFLTKNTKIVKTSREELERYKQELSMGDVPLNRYNEINAALKNTENSMRALGRLGSSLKDQISQAANSFTQWISVSSVIMSVAYQLQKIPKEVKAIDDSMTDLIMATGIGVEQAEELMNTYAKLGDKLKATMTDVSASSTEWIKQGKSIQEALALAEDSIVLSKIGGLSSEDSTKTITAAMKSYDLAEEEVMGFIDQISSIDMASATDVAGLSNAFNEVAANAKNAGIETKQLLAYSAAIGETTQEGMSSVGNSLNAMFSRMGNIKLSRLTDPETNEDLSNVETSLRNVGIELRSEIGTFRDFDDVLEEVAHKWETYDDVTQRSIASSIAGTNHLNDFFVLMSQWSNVEKYIEEATNSSGSSMEKFSVYQDSIAAKLERMENAFQSLSKTVLDSNFLGGLVDAGTGFIKILDTITGKLGTIPTLLGGAGITAFVKNFDKLDESVLKIA